MSRDVCDIKDETASSELGVESIRATTTITRRRTAFWATVFVVWTLLALISTAQAALFLGHTGREIDWIRLLVPRLLDWYTCALFTPLLLWLVRRFPIMRGERLRNIPPLMLASAGIALAKFALFLPVGRRFAPQEQISFGQLVSTNLLMEITVFWSVIGILHAVEYYRRYEERARDAVEIRAELVDAQLRALRSQLHPHFLFNTINSVIALMRRDPHTAEMMLKGFADLLRATLQDWAPHETTVREETALLERFLDIARMRFGSRLQAVVETTPEVQGAMLPNFILQPLVENALEHGVERRAGPGRVVIRAFEQGDWLTVTVYNDGGNPLMPTSSRARSGIGLRNSRERLERLYRDRQSLSLERLEEGGTMVTLVVPLHFA